MSANGIQHSGTTMVVEEHMVVEHMVVEHMVVCSPSMVVCWWGSPCPSGSVC